MDDVRANLLALETILAPLEQELVLAASGPEALRLLLKKDFAVILLDVRMPGMDGLETAHLIRQRQRTETTPIIFVTAYNDAEMDQAGAYTSVGAADFVFKPLQPEILRAKVSVFVELFRRTELIKGQADHLRRLEDRDHRRRLTAAERSQQETEARFSKVLEMAGDAITVLDSKQRVVLFSKGAEQVFGADASEVVGRPLPDLIPDGIDDPEDGIATRREVLARRLDGTVFPAEATYSRLDREGETVYTLILRDVTEQKQTVAQIEKLNRDLNSRLATGIDMVADLAESLDPRRISERMIRRALQALNADQGVVVRERDGRMVVYGSFGIGGMEPLRAGTRLVSRDVEKAIREGKRLVNGSLAGMRGMLRTAVLPLNVRAGERAALLLGRARDEPFDAGDLEMLGLIANVAVVAIRNAELFVEADAASRSKSEFLNLAAHELRTPLSVVTGYISMLADGTFGQAPEAFEHVLQILLGKSEELNKLVNDLLLAARMEGGLVPGAMVDLDLAEAAAQAVARAQGHAGLLGASLELEVPPSRVLVRADADHVGRILDNLINNALNYSFEAPWLKLVVRSDGSITVEDRGAGIPADRQERIFERFYRGNDTDFVAQPGTGLGLFLSRRLAEAVNGSLELEWSRPGEGSRFVLSLQPAAEGTPALKGVAAGSLPATA